MTKLKIAIIAFLGAALVVVLSACGGSSVSGAGKPDWIRGKPDGSIYAAASAKIKNDSVEFAINEATTKARASLASSLNAKIEEVTKIIEENGQSDTVRAIRQRTNEMLIGVARVDTWVDNSKGIIWVKVAISETHIAAAKKNSGNNTRVNQEAAKAISEAVDSILDQPLVAE